MVLDKVWMLTNGKDVLYCIGSSGKDVWHQVISQEFMGTAVTKEMLQKKGYVAKRISLVLEK